MRFLVSGLTGNNCIIKNNPEKINPFAQKNVPNDHCQRGVFQNVKYFYSLDAWKTEASGFLLKPLTPKGLKEQLKKLRYRSL